MENARTIKRTISLKKCPNGYELNALVDDNDKVIEFSVDEVEDDHPNGTFYKSHCNGTLDNCLDYITKYIDGNTTTKARFNIGDTVFFVSDCTIYKDIINKAMLCNNGAIKYYTAKKGFKFYSDSDVCLSFNETKERLMIKIMALQEADLT